MHIDSNNDKPIFMQIAEQLELAIFGGAFVEDSKIPSTNELATLLNINPHTVLRGMNILVDEGIIYKKRGLGMFVQTGAVDKIRQKRQVNFYNLYISPLVKEAIKLQMEKAALIQLIERGYQDERNHS